MSAMETDLKIFEGSAKAHNVFDLLSIPNPEDPEFPQYAFDLTRKIAVRLADKGWKFHEKEGPRGFFYEASNGKGLKIMGDQKPTKQEAFLVALNRANRLQHPIP